MTMGRSELCSAFEWLGWSPKQGTPTATTLETCFPGAIPGSALVARVSTLLLEHDITPDNAILGTSFCADEINNEPGDMADQLRTYFGKVFPMGGIGGAPFVGKTGFKAFSHHVPDGGHVVVIFGPHVAISVTGEVGKYHRIGQHHESTACGAFTAALAQCQAGHDHFDPHDAQQCWLRDSVRPHVPGIKEAPNANAALAHVAYDIIASSIDNVVNTDFGSGMLVLIGGIQINMASPLEDHFLPNLFLVKRQGEPTLDLLPLLSS